MKVLVTGGAGFIGSHVVDKLLARGHEVRIFDLAVSPYHGGEVETVRGDLLDAAALRVAVRGCHAVAHLAAAADVNLVLADPVKAELLNAHGTELLLESCRAEDVDRVLYASTIWVYGDAGGNSLVDEDTPLPPPAHLYTATKIAGELYCSAYGALFGREYTILRFGIPYGPRARPATVLAAFVQRARAGEPIQIAGDGSQSRRFVYVEDLADGVVAALDPAAAGRVYNLVGDENVSVRQIAETVCAIVGEVPITFAEGRTGDLQGARISGARAAGELGWRPTTAFAEGARRYMDWVSETAGKPSEATAASTAGSAPSMASKEPGRL